MLIRAISPTVGLDCISFCSAGRESLSASNGPPAMDALTSRTMKTGNIV